MADATPDATLDRVRRELLERLGDLDAQLERDGAEDAREFFAGVARSVAAAGDFPDLADAFIALSTAGFRGYRYSPPAAALADRVLALAQELAAALSAEGPPQ